MKKRTAFLMITFASLQIHAQQVKEILVKENTKACEGVAPMDCMQIRYLKDTDWTHFYSNIEGFDYEPGYRYRLRISETPIPLEKVPADGSSIAYRLESLISKIKVEDNQQSILDYITKSNWKLIQMKGNSKKAYNQSLRFNMDHKSINGYAGCNSFGGTFLLDEKTSQLAVGDLFTTKMACKSSKLETEFLNTLKNKVLRFDVADQTLNFYEGNELVLMFAVSNQD